ncbi:MAG: hypothetical protein AUG44_00015 [Actinobacteria bacterium 13_1_20CM_3_71_11]|nr:MAG: hypothetical protein AUG44_00015 [Actinobacteria bacterium 13_1_20CM_3_71_11]
MRSAYCTGCGRCVPWYAAASSAANRPTDQPSAAMWWNVTSNAWSSGPQWSSSARTGHPASRSKGRRPSPISRAVTSSPVSSGTWANGTGAGGSTAADGSPSTAGYRVRSTSLRATTVSSARRSRSMSSRPRSRHATGMW